ncbi:hypothetical protein [Novosphingobium mangrovi (ex Huang et al. 2023)]|uniref:Phasin domain-containing protein n=1 Tax=Novosphingobium mangrovi (ex Huang et al. 2023) TaxID=2976432 RepID=A0ABT2I3F0_9SPHN|nr:hypothetical protein [Novosphingobium mangrovi (ex Huang et al. 2023)]MCT2399331.1 hypothetical protein [Novosphingobium mangrovi (ex Huang et al. 2023)]
MSMTITAAAARISRQLPEAELSLDSALLASTRLMESMLLARGAEGVQVYAAQNALMRLAKTQRSLIETQNDMIRVHRDLLDAGREVKAIGDDAGNCPDQSVGLLVEVEPARQQA